MISILHLIRRAPAVLVRPPQSKLLALNIQKSIRLGVDPSTLPIAALEDLIQRPGVLATPRDLEAWARIDVLLGSKSLRAALEGFASADRPMTVFIACRLLSNCASLRVSTQVVEYLARHLPADGPNAHRGGECPW